MSYTQYANGAMLGGSVKQDHARSLFALRSVEAGKLMRAGHAKKDAWAMVCAEKPKHHKVKVHLKKVMEEDKGGAILSGRVHHVKKHHAKKHPVHRVGLALREHM